MSGAAARALAAALRAQDEAAGLDIRPDSVAARVLRLHDVLVGEYKQGYNIVLVVDVSGSMEGNLPLLRAASTQLFARLRPDDVARAIERAVVRGRRVAPHVRALVVPGSRRVLAEHLHCPFVPDQIPI